MRHSAIVAIVLLFAGGTGIAAEDIRDVRPPVAFPAGHRFAIIVVVILLGILLAWLIRRFLKNRPALGRREVPLPPPWDLAFTQLKQLKDDNLPGQGRIKDYYTRLSGIVRRYIEARFDIRAPEMTTEEFLWSLRSSDKLTTPQKEALGQFLTCCDMVKFARYGSTPQEIETSFALAERLVSETKKTTIEG